MRDFFKIHFESSYWAFTSVFKIFINSFYVDVFNFSFVKGSLRIFCQKITVYSQVALLCTVTPYRNIFSADMRKSFTPTKMENIRVKMISSWRIVGDLLIKYLCNPGWMHRENPKTYLIFPTQSSRLTGQIPTIATLYRDRDLIPFMLEYFWNLSLSFH